MHCPRHRLPKLNNQTYQLNCVHNHYNLINAWLRVTGPTNEQQMCNVLLLLQVACCTVALVIRYIVADYFF